jgi:hypothetical protein
MFRIVLQPAVMLKVVSIQAVAAIRFEVTVCAR